jgi:hypothetical protein
LVHQHSAREAKRLGPQKIYIDAVILLDPHLELRWTRD